MRDLLTRRKTRAADQASSFQRWIKQRKKTHAGMLPPSVSPGSAMEPYPHRCMVEGIAVTAFPNPQSLFERVVLDTREAAASGRQTLVHYLNVHVSNQAFANKSLQHVLQSSPLVYCDGSGVAMGARILGEHIPVRLTAADWFMDMLRWYAKSKLTVFLLGGAPGVPDKAMAIIDREVPEHTVLGAHHGYFLKDQALEEDVVQTINRLRPDIVIVGFGTPLQELWMEQHAHRLKVSTVYAIGAVLDFVTGHVKRCPSWMGDAGCEWLYRLYTEPRRLMGRYVVGNPWFLSRVAYYYALKKKDTLKAAVADQMRTRMHRALAAWRTAHGSSHGGTSVMPDPDAGGRPDLVRPVSHEPTLPPQGEAVPVES